MLLEKLEVNDRGAKKIIMKSNDNREQKNRQTHRNNIGQHKYRKTNKIKKMKLNVTLFLMKKLGFT